MTSRIFHQQLGSCPRRLHAHRSHRSQSAPSPWHHHHHRRGAIALHRHYDRGIVTSSTPPSPDVFIERPEVMVLAESSLYDQSWKDSCASFYPSVGLHFATIDIMKPTGDGGNGTERPSLKSLERTMADDLSRLGESTDPLADLFVAGHAMPPMSNSAHAVLIARGPLQCLVAQYFVESLPLAGLVLVDPLLLPEDGRAGTTKTESKGKGSRENRWEESLSDLISMLDENAPDGASASLDSELSLLRSMANKNDNRRSEARPLRLEPGSVPTLVCYSGGGGGADLVRGDRHRVCAERTAAFHTCGGKGDYFDQVSVLKVPKKGGGEGGTAMDDLDRLAKTVYEWYDEVVA